jgi:HSP20 family molecular chaperone IbpA
LFKDSPEESVMTRPPLFDSPFLLGFEHTRTLVERAAKAAAEAYPPYNVEQREDGGVRITLAVAGFSPDQLQVSVEDRQLVVSGRREGEARDGGGAYLHRGIAARSFVRTFVLADGMEVTGAELSHGLLHVDVARPEPQAQSKRIPIRVAG